MCRPRCPTCGAHADPFTTIRFDPLPQPDPFGAEFMAAIEALRKRNEELAGIPSRYVDPLSGAEVHDEVVDA